TPPSTDSARSSLFFFCNDTPTPAIYTLSLHDALPISCTTSRLGPGLNSAVSGGSSKATGLAKAERASASEKVAARPSEAKRFMRSEEHTSELQSLTNLVCRLLLEKQNREDPRHMPRAR